jgi:hypothetical protein
MAALTYACRAHIRTTPKGVCGIVRSCTAHKKPIVEFVQAERPKGIPLLPSGEAPTHNK